MNEARSFDLIASEDRAKPRAAKSEPLLSDIKTCDAVHVMEPELLIRIVPFGAETG
jgi:hypothetical protein